MTGPVSSCRTCPTPTGKADVCAGCLNTLAGLCRWCGDHAPTGDSTLCARCGCVPDAVAEAEGALS